MWRAPGLRPQPSGFQQIEQQKQVLIGLFDDGLSGEPSREIRGPVLTHRAARDHLPLNRRPACGGVIRAGPGGVATAGRIEPVCTSRRFLGKPSS